MANARDSGPLSSFHGCNLPFLSRRIIIFQSLSESAPGALMSTLTHHLGSSWEPPSGGSAYPPVLQLRKLRPCTVLFLVTQLCPTLCNPMDYSPPGSSIHGDSPGKNTEAGCHALPQGIFPTQGLNPGLPHCRQLLYHLSHQGSSKTLIETPRNMFDQIPGHLMAQSN